MRRVRAHAHQNVAVFHHGAGEHVVAYGAFDGKRLAGQRGLVHHGGALLDHAVDANRHAGAHGHQIARYKLGGGHGGFGVALDLLRLVGHIQKRIDELVFAHGARVVFQKLAHVQQEHGLGGGVEVALHEGNADGRSIQHGHREPRVREFAQGGAQKRKEACHGDDSADGRGQEPLARIAGADHHGQIHEQRVGARLELHRIAAFRLGDFVGVNLAQRVQHAGSLGRVEIN